MTISKEITVEDNKIIFHFPYTVGLKNQIKSLRGSDFDDKSMKWVMVASHSNAQRAIKFGNKFGFMLSTDLIDLTIDRAPVLNRRRLYDFQKAGVDFCHQNDGTCLIADDVGCIGGDAEVIINRGGAGRRYKLSDAYNRFHGIDTRYTWSNKVDSYTKHHPEIDELLKEAKQ